MRTFCSENGAQLLIAAIPSREQVYSVREAGAYFSVTLPQAFIEAFAADEGIAFIDLLGDLRSLAVGSGAELYVPGDIHLNNAGHRVIGESLHGWFEEVRQHHASPQSPG